MMLARVADSLYWIGRYIERAEHVSRLSAVMLNATLDTETDEGPSPADPEDVHGDEEAEDEAAPEWEEAAVDPGVEDEESIHDPGLASGRTEMVAEPTGTECAGTGMVSEGTTMDSESTDPEEADLSGTIGTEGDSSHPSSDVA